MMPFKTALLSAASLLAMLHARPAHATAAEEAASRCTALRQHDFSQLPDAPAQISAASVTTLAPNLPQICKVDGYVSANVGFSLVLPVKDWNGKYLQGGCGGACGISLPFWCHDAIRRGYACLGQDMGHRSTTSDWQWARDNLALQADFGFRSTHDASVAGKAITAIFYGQRPSHAYFMGCSTGGRQANVLAQRFPADFDGIVAGSAPFDEIGSGLQLAWTTLANMDGHGGYFLLERQAHLIHDAVVKQCDMNDGAQDGLIGDPRRCGFDPGTLACKAGADPANCLTAPQVAAVRKMYGGPVDSSGHRIGTQGGVMPGSELNWIGDYMPRGDKPPQYAGFITSFFRYMAFTPSPPVAWTLTDLNFDRDRDRFGNAEFLFDAQDPDLRSFKRRGGKLLAYQGWADTSVVPMGSLDHYDLVTRTMGGLSHTQDFYRLFVVPGMRHCTGDGEGGDVIDFLAALEDWVERGQAPEALIGHQVQVQLPLVSTPIFPIAPERIRKTRVAFPYPDEAHYKGKGDLNDPANWERVPGLPQASE